MNRTVSADRKEMTSQTSLTYEGCHAVSMTHVWCEDLINIIRMSQCTYDPSLVSIQFCLEKCIL